MRGLIRPFRDWLKNPRRFRRDAREYERQFAEISAPADSRTIQAMVEQLLVEAPDLMLCQRIRAQGQRADPALVAAVQDPRFRERKPGTDPSARLPIEHVLGLLAETNPSEAAEPAAALLAHESAAVRRNAAHLLGSIGDDTCAESVACALGDADDNVRSYAAMGIRKALEQPRCTPGFLDAEG